MGGFFLLDGARKHFPSEEKVWCEECGTWMDMNLPAVQASITKKDATLLMHGAHPCALPCRLFARLGAIILLMLICFESLLTQGGIRSRDSFGHAHPAITSTSKGNASSSRKHEPGRSRQKTLCSVSHSWTPGCLCAGSGTSSTAVHRRSRRSWSRWRKRAFCPTAAR